MAAIYFSLFFFCVSTTRQVQYLHSNLDKGLWSYYQMYTLLFFLLIMCLDTSTTQMQHEKAVCECFKNHWCCTVFTYEYSFPVSSKMFYHDIFTSQTHKHTHTHKALKSLQLTAAVTQLLPPSDSTGMSGTTQTLEPSVANPPGAGLVTRRRTVQVS